MDKHACNVLKAVGVSIKEGKIYKGRILYSGGDGVLAAMDTGCKYIDGEDIILVIKLGGGCLYLEKGSRWVVEQEYLELKGLACIAPVCIN